MMNMTIVFFSYLWWAYYVQMSQLLDGLVPRQSTFTPNTVNISDQKNMFGDPHIFIGAVNLFQIIIKQMALAAFMVN